jgi:hypothetical protein
LQHLLATKLEGDWIHLENFSTAIFGYYVLWLKNKPLVPFEDLSMRMRGNRVFINPAIGQSAAYPPDVTMEMLADATNDQDTAAMSAARRLFCAYFMGQDIGALYFQDAVMNTIIRLFQPGQLIPTALIDEAYLRSSTGLAGLRKFLVDYYVWGCLPPPMSELPRLCLIHGLPKSQIPPLSEYPYAFRTGVETTHENVRTDIPARTHALSKPRQKEYLDTEIDFSNLDSFMRNAKGGALRCRYHQHTNVDVCFNLMA